MTPLTYTLLADGPSDRCLLRIIDWLLGSLPSISGRGIIAQFFDERIAGRASTLSGRMIAATTQYPCEILFVHRDAEGKPMEDRLQEIMHAADEAQIQLRVPVIPVRMTEAWLLVEIDAIRRAADNPNGTVALTLPRLQDVESVPDPKQVLKELLLRASEKTGRRRDQFERDLSSRLARVASLIRDFSGLRKLTAFSHFAAEATRAVDAWSEATRGESA